MKICVTGGAGFIGSAVIRHIIAEGRDEVVNLDKLTYASNPQGLRDIEGHPAYAFEKADICDGARIKEILETHRPDTIMHLAAESHVDRSIDGPVEFLETNVMGTFRLLEASAAYYKDLPSERQGRFRFHHVSTDEVFGSLGESDMAFKPDHPYDPRSPYSATKAASDHLVRAWFHTFGLPVVLSNCSNNYGPHQFPEKLIPLMIISAVKGRPLPIYGKGDNIRDWLFVSDHAEALLSILRKGEVGRSYLVGGGSERRNIDVVRAICKLLDQRLPDSPHRPHENLITFVSNRPGHDFRYAIDDSGTRSTLGWRPRKTFEQGLTETVDWYLANQDWWEWLTAERYDGQRIGLGEKETKC